MTIYRYVKDSDRYQDFYVDAQHKDVIDRLYSAEPVADSWTPIRIHVESTPSEVVESEVRKAPALSALYGGTPVFSERAWNALKPLIGRDVEALPVTCSAGTFVIIHVLNVVDCLDHGASRVTRFSDGDIMCVDSYVFLSPDVTGKHHFFKIPETSEMEVLVSDQFKREVERHDLEGAIFETVACSTE